VRSVATTGVLSAVLWSLDNDVWSYDRINSQIAACLVIPFNTFYYFYQHADMAFSRKVLMQVANILYSVWLMVVLFANIPRLFVHESFRAEFGCVWAVIYLSYAFCY
jgi:hypothetical protein